MMNKILNMLSITLFAFVVSYLMASVFDKYGLQTNTVINSILIIVSTFTIVSITIVVIIQINRFVATKLYTNK